MESIRALLEQLAIESFQMLLFLKHISRVEVREGFGGGGHFSMGVMEGRYRRSLAAYRDELDVRSAQTAPTHTPAVETVCQQTTSRKQWMLPTAASRKLCQR